MRPFQPQLPSRGQYTNMSLSDMKAVTLQLSQLLSTETDLLTAMRLKEIPALQAEKLRLSQKLEAFQRLLASDDSIVREAGEEEREEVLALTDHLAATIEENMHRTTIAQNVNQRVLRTLMDAVREKQSTGAYGQSGAVRGNTQTSISLNLNERA